MFFCTVLMLIKRCIYKYFIMRVFSLKGRFIFRKAIASLLSSMGFASLYATEMRPEALLDTLPVRDSISQERMMVLYGCPTADFKFNGQVIDQSGKPLENVEVRILQCGYEEEAVSDADGLFKIEYENMPWCDIEISAKNDYASAIDSIKLDPDTNRDDFIIPEERRNSAFFYGVYSKDITIILNEDGGLGKIIFGSPASVQDKGADKVLLFSNPVENYLWFNMQEVENANVAIYDFRGEKVMDALVSNGGNLYVGDLKSGNYLLTVISGDKKYVAKFIKK